MRLVVCPNCATAIDEIGAIVDEYVNQEVKKIIAEKNIHPRMIDLYENKDEDCRLLFEFLGFDKRKYCCNIRAKLYRDDIKTMHEVDMID